MIRVVLNNYTVIDSTSGSKAVRHTVSPHPVAKSANPLDL